MSIYETKWGFVCMIVFVVVVAVFCLFVLLLGGWGGGGGGGLIRVKKISLLDIFRIISVMCKTFSRACSQPGFSLDFAVSFLTQAAPTLL